MCGMQVNEREANASAEHWATGDADEPSARLQLFARLFSLDERRSPAEVVRFVNLVYHWHDEHHDHIHPPGLVVREPHSHHHAHAPIRYPDPHFQDLHHRHPH